MTTYVSPIGSPLLRWLWPELWALREELKAYQLCNKYFGGGLLDKSPRSSLIHWKREQGFMGWPA